jgi:hypothetical protein
VLDAACRRRGWEQQMQQMLHIVSHYATIRKISLITAYYLPTVNS